MTHRHVNRQRDGPIDMDVPDPDELLDRMRDDGESDWVDRLIDNLSFVSGRNLPGAGLTPRELDVLRCLSVGLTTRMSADVLGIGHYTVRQHQRGAILRLKAKNLTHAVALAMRQGLIQ